jgi:hypothetical protein
MLFQTQQQQLVQRVLGYRQDQECQVVPADHHDLEDHHDQVDRQDQQDLLDQ